MSTFKHRNDLISKVRLASTQLLTAAADLNEYKAAWNRGLSQQIVDATGSDPSAVGFKPNDFASHEGIVKADINKILGTALDGLNTLLDSADGRKFEEVAL
jgi:hypothetical protein